MNQVQSLYSVYYHRQRGNLIENFKILNDFINVQMGTAEHTCTLHLFFISLKGWLLVNCGSSSSHLNICEVIQDFKVFN